jgi:uncharacterized protein YoaH (UPF0181 family)
LQLLSAARVQARGDLRDLKSKASELKAEVKLQRGILEPHLDAFYEQQQLEGGMAMSQVQSLIASGMSVKRAMAEVREQYSTHAVVRRSQLIPPEFEFMRI